MAEKNSGKPVALLSPSAINLYFQCPRRFYYRYIMKLPSKESIHCIRGNVVHDTLERIYDLDRESLTESNYRGVIEGRMHALHNKGWEKAMPKLKGLGMRDSELTLFYDDSTVQLDTWLNDFTNRLRKKSGELGDIRKAWDYFMPKYREIELRSDSLGVRGFLDHVMLLGSRHIIIDYKTSRSLKISPEYKFQMAVYHMLYHERFNAKPETYIWFLRFGLQKVDIDDRIICDAKSMINDVIDALKSEKESEFEKRVSGLCKWCNANGSGQCDFYDECKPHDDCG